MKSKINRRSFNHADRTDRDLMDSYENFNALVNEKYLYYSISRDTGAQ